MPSKSPSMVSVALFAEIDRRMVRQAELTPFLQARHFHSRSSAVSRWIESAKTAPPSDVIQPAAVMRTFFLCSVMRDLRHILVPTAFARLRRTLRVANSEAWTFAKRIGNILNPDTDRYSRAYMLSRHCEAHQARGSFCWLTSTCFKSCRRFVGW